MTRIAPLVLCAALIGAAACSSRSGPQFDRADVDNIKKAEDAWTTVAKEFANEPAVAMRRNIKMLETARKELGEEVEIGFSIAQDYQGQGLATEAIIAASRWAFEAYELDTIVAVTSAVNTASKRTLARAGFVHDRDESMNFQGTVQDVSVYALSPGAVHDIDR